MLSGCRATVDMMQIGSGKPWQTGVQSPASQVISPAKKGVRYNKRRYRRRNRIERMFGSLKDWRRVSTWYDRCPKVFLSAIALAATVIF